MMHVVFGSEILLKPIDQTLERKMILRVEIKASGLYFDKLSDDFFFRNICKNDILRIFIENYEPIRDLINIILFFFLKKFTQIFIFISFEKFSMLGGIAQTSIARS